jgi:hypothetical protein
MASRGISCCMISWPRFVEFQIDSLVESLVVSPSLDSVDSWSRGPKPPLQQPIFPVLVPNLSILLTVIDLFTHKVAGHRV